MNWLKQADEPLFPDILWSRPENRRHAGKLLIIGGHSQSFSAVSEAYAAARLAGAGTVRVIVPDKLRPMLSTIFPEAEYGASTDIGSFSRQAMAEVLDAADWADGVLLAGDFGRNSETAVLLENIVSRYKGLLCLAGDSVDNFLSKELRQQLATRPDTIVVADPGHLQKLALPHLIKQSSDFTKFIEQVSSWAEKTKMGIATWHSGKVIAVYQDNLSSTPCNRLNEAELAAYVSVWTMQQATRPFESLTTAVYCFINK